MTIRSTGTNGQKIDIDKLCEAINNTKDVHTIIRMKQQLQLMFPEILWTWAIRPGNWRIHAQTQIGYKPQSNRTN